MDNILRNFGMFCGGLHHDSDGQVPHGSAQSGQQLTFNLSGAVHEQATPHHHRFGFLPLLQPPCCPHTLLATRLPPRPWMRVTKWPKPTPKPKTASAVKASAAVTRKPPRPKMASAARASVVATKARPKTASAVKANAAATRRSKTPRSHKGSQCPGLCPPSGTPQGLTDLSQSLT